MRFNLLIMVITNVLMIKIPANTFYKNAVKCLRKLPEENSNSHKTEENGLIIHWKFKI